MSGKILYSQRQIAEMAGISQQMVSYILKGDRQPSIDMAVKLENATGICREAWLWPERHMNPYIPFSNGVVCVTCANRVNRVKVVNKIIRRIYRETKDFDQMVEAALVYNGIKNDEIVFRYREVKEDGLHPLNNERRYPAADVLTREMMGSHYDDLFRDGFVTHGHMLRTTETTRGTLDHEETYEYVLKQGMRSGLIVIGPKRRLTWTLANYVSEMRFTPELIEEMTNHTAKVEAMWLEDQAQSPSP